MIADQVVVAAAAAAQQYTFWGAAEDFSFQEVTVTMNVQGGQGAGAQLGFVGAVAIGTGTYPSPTDQPEALSTPRTCKSLR